MFSALGRGAGALRTWSRSFSPAKTHKSARALRRIGVVRLFVSGESWYARTEQDWPDKRLASETTVRAYRAQRELGRAVVVLFRVEGFGPYAGGLQELDDFADGTRLLEHPNVTHWIARQIEELQTLTAIR